VERSVKWMQLYTTATTFIIITRRRKARQPHHCVNIRRKTSCHRRRRRLKWNFIGIGSDRNVFVRALDGNTEDREPKGERVPWLFPNVNRIKLQTNCVAVIVDKYLNY
jgi:hypothetical protein